jgi:hypothetical protein
MFTAQVPAADFWGMFSFGSKKTPAAPLLPKEAQSGIQTVRPSIVTPVNIAEVGIPENRSPEELSKRRVAQLWIPDFESPELKTPQTVTLFRGEKRHLFGVAKNEAGQLLQGMKISWAVVDDAILDVKPNGQLIAKKVGVTELKVSVNEQKRTIRVEVLPVRIAGQAAESGQSGIPNKQVEKVALVQGGGSANEDRRVYLSSNNAVGNPAGRVVESDGPKSSSNASAEKAGTENFNFQLPLLSLEGRGLDVNLTATYNSRLWERSLKYNFNGTTSTRISFNQDASWLAPGFALGFGRVINFSAPDFAGYVADFQMPDGTRVRLQSRNPNVGFAQVLESLNIPGYRFEANIGGTSSAPILNGGTLYTPNGNRLTISSSGLVTKVLDPNGNYMLIAYSGTTGSISAIQDSMGRTITFNYSAGLLSSITAPGFGAGPDRTVAEFRYQSLNVNGTFASGIVRNPTTGSTVNVLRYVRFPGINNGFKYDYSAYGMIYRTTRLHSMSPLGAGIYDEFSGVEAARTEYNYPTTASALASIPKYTNRKDWWAGMPDPNQPAVTGFSETIGSIGPKQVKITTTTKPDGTKSETTQIFYSFDDQSGDKWDDGLVVKVRDLKSDGTTVVRLQENTWESVDFYNGTNGLNGQNWGRLKRTAIQDEAGNWVSREFAYDGYGNVTEAKDFDCQACSAPVLKRSTTSYKYQADPAYANTAVAGRYLISLPTTSRLYNGTSALVSQTEYNYDQTTPENCVGITAYENPNTNVRGNLTSITKYADISSDGKVSTPLVETISYDTAGNTRVKSDIQLGQVEYVYSAVIGGQTFNYNFAYPVQVKRGIAGQLTSTNYFDQNTGLVTQNVDENAKATTFTYQSTTLRRLKTTYPDGGEQTQVFQDNLVPYPAGSGKFAIQVESRVKMPAGNNPSELPTVTYLDGRGAILRESRWTSDGWLARDYEYNALGQLTKADNPYLVPSSDSIQNKPNQFTTQTYDELGRPLQFFAQDSASNQPLTSYAYSGRVVTATDAAGRQRRTISDALGNIIRVDEPDASGQLGTVASPTQPTNYTYDVRGLLVRIEQGVQNRYFRYDGIGRRTHTRLPEQSAPNYFFDGVTGNDSWSTAVQFDNSGRPLFQYDARGIRTGFTYDGLNRVTYIGYTVFSGGQWVSDPNYPTKSFTYDGATNGLGRLWKSSVDSVYDARDTETIVNSYDAMGRTTSLSQRQNGWGQWFTYTTTRSYDILGNVTQQTYPSGRTVTNTFDSTGRLSAFSGNLGGTSKTYVTSTTYGPRGRVYENYGTDTPLRQWNGYTIRGDRSFVTLSTLNDTTGWNRGMIVNNYTTQPVFGGSSSDSTGQVRRTHHYVPDNDSVTSWKISVQDYSYDTLGRVSQVTEYAGTGTNSTGDTYTNSLQQVYQYDRYGNRTINAPSSYNVGNKQFSVTTANNRLGVPAGQPGTMSFDGNGNLTVDSYTRPVGAGTRVFDADDRTISTDIANGGVQYDVYNAVGNRVKVSGTTSPNVWRPETWYVYGIDGELLAEYESNYTATAPVVEYANRGGEALVEARSNGFRWRITDNLGSPRMSFDQTGSLASMQRQDFLPFGEETVTQGIRSTANGYGVGAAKYKFQGLERDTGSGYDNTLATKFDRDQGRYITLGNPIVSFDPQSLNPYAFGGNDPVNLGLLSKQLTWLQVNTVQSNQKFRSLEIPSTGSDTAKGSQDLFNSMVQARIERRATTAQYRQLSRAKTSFDYLGSVPVIPTLGEFDKVFYRMTVSIPGHKGVFYLNDDEGLEVPDPELQDVPFGPQTALIPNDYSVGASRFGITTTLTINRPGFLAIQREYLFPGKANEMEQAEREYLYNLALYNRARGIKVPTNFGWGIGTFGGGAVGSKPFYIQAAEALSGWVRTIKPQ